MCRVGLQYSPLAALRLSTDATRRFKRVGRAIAVIRKLLMSPESRFSSLNARELLEAVSLSADNQDGVTIEPPPEKFAT